MRVLDLFSGIGGFSLGLERAGMITVAFCEQDAFCQAVIKKHWPKVKLYDDVKTLTKSKLDADGITVDVICGGFPCQDISIAGKGAGLTGEHSGLWYEFYRLIKEKDRVRVLQVLRNKKETTTILSDITPDNHTHNNFSTFYHTTTRNDIF